MEDPVTLRVGPLTIDPGSKTVWKQDDRISVTQREFDLLLLLGRNTGKALSRMIIRQGLWPDGEISSASRTIDMHVRHLRSKLEDDPAEPRYILTIPGVGYMMEDPHKNESDEDNNV